MKSPLDETTVDYLRKFLHALELGLREPGLTTKELARRLGYADSPGLESLKNKARRLLGVDLFPKRARGGAIDTGTEPSNRSELERLIHHLHAISHHLEYLTTSERVTIAASQSILPYFGPEAAREAVASLGEDYKRIVVECSHGSPQELVGRLRAGASHNITLTSIDPEEEALLEDVDELTTDFHELPMYLMVDRRHKLAELPDDEVTWDAVRKHGTTVVLQDDALRRPKPNYPPGLNRSGCHTRSAPSYLDAYASVITGGNIACIGFPQFLDPYQRARVRAIRNDHLDLRDVRVVVAKQTFKWMSDAATTLVNRIYGLLVERLDDAARHAREQGLSGLLPADLRTTRFVARNRDRSPDWYTGRLDHVVVTRTGYLDADHVVQSNSFEGGQEMFAISGRVTALNTASRGPFHVMWGGRNVFEERPQEHYGVSIIANHEDLKAKLLLGRWFGRVSAIRDDLVADNGFFVLCGNNCSISNADLERRCWDRFKDTVWSRPEFEREQRPHGGHTR